MFSRITSVICSIFLMVLAINGAAFTADVMHKLSGNQEQTREWTTNQRVLTKG